ncbi:hypothetical protein GYMLUDRAFT_252087 [Collybiopsis luxurians FD-317 M1]|uniref:Uncharacterized protein n=1 Tax=Collybiopsis luxurians FD-317 M1 TaxID=944289 RepID=A0A0D0BP86_9AGAR|nr:hypothetical protein GYMLUDRAFT_252087 [Collybiopsis luxurians FD-317 M1]
MPETDAVKYTITDGKALYIAWEAERRKDQNDIDTLLDGFRTAVEILKDTGEMLHDVPHVKAVAEIVLQVLQIFDENKENKEKCYKIIAKTA